MEMEIDIFGIDTATKINIFGYDLFIFSGLKFIFGVLLIMLILSIMLRIAVKRQAIDKEPAPIIVLAETLWQFAGGTVEGLDEKHHLNSMHVFAANLFLFMLLINTAGLWGTHPPAANAFIAVALGIIVAILVHVQGLFLSPLQYLKSYTSPSLLMLPINIMEAFSQIISVSMRLFGNMLAGIVLAQLLHSAFSMIGMVAVGIFYPTIGGLLSIYSDLFIACIQSLIFTTLTMSYIKGKLLPEH